MKKVIIGIVVIGMLGGGIWFLSSSSAKQRVQSQENFQHVSSSVPVGSVSYAMNDVASHNTAQSCWTTINGKVYDVTSFISQHPGGPQAVLSLCGTDGTSAFEAQHGGQDRPQNELDSFYIGDLSQ